MYDIKLADIAGTKRWNLLRAKIDDLEINSKIKNIGNLYKGISDFKKSYQPRTNIVKDEKGDLVKDTHSIGRGIISLSY